MHLSPGIRAIEPYPFEELDRRKQEALSSGAALIDFGVGDPREETPVFIREALREALAPISSYPRAAGLPELREAIVGWIHRRFGVALDPGRDVLPVLGSKEVVFSLAQSLVDPSAGRNLVVVTAPGYPIPERGARFAGADVVRLPLTEPNSFLAPLESVEAHVWDRTALLWLNYPNNPTGAVAHIDYLQRAAALAQRHGFLLASDEAYSELWFDGEPPPSILQVGELRNVLVVNTLSKRSSMTGYRSGFVAGDREMIAAMKALRPAVGVTPQEFVQRASIVAWNDETHVEESRARYAAKRRLFLELFAARGVEVAGSAASFYLWVKVPGGRSSAEWALDLLDRGVVVAPGSFFGPEGEGFVRMAMVPALDDCERAAAILSDVLPDATSVNA